MDASILLSMAGGLGLFLFGMHTMSDAIEKAAGARLRSILEFFTTNRFTGMLVGMIFTAIIQSSSACTVMVVSFVNSGLMNLYQAAGVIFGANIGTTITSQLVSFNLSEYAPIFLLFGAVFVMFCKNPKIVKIAEVVLGFGVLFTGLSSLSSAMSALRDVPVVVNMLSTLKSPVLAVIVGTLLTSIIQSSSVTVSIALLMCNQGLLGLNICLFIILGCNIGACTPAVLTSMTGKKDAKRAAMIHLMFNVIGTIIVFFIFLFGMEPVLALLHKISGDNLGRCVANAHTLVKIFQVVILLPFSTWIVNLTYLIVPGEEKSVNYRDDHQLKYIGETAVFNPATAVVDVLKEVERMAYLASENLNRAMNALITLDEEDIKEVREVEKNIDFLSKSITDYLVKINQTTLPIEDLKSLGALFHVVNDIERIGDHAEDFADCAQRRVDGNLSFSKEAITELGDILNMVNTTVQFAISTIHDTNDEHLEDVVRLEQAVDEKERELQQAHVDRLTKNECTPEAGKLYSDVVSGLERIADHATNIVLYLNKAENS